MALNFRESIQSADPFDLLTSYKVNQPARKSCQVKTYKNFLMYYKLYHYNLYFIACIWRGSL